MELFLNLNNDWKQLVYKNWLLLKMLQYPLDLFLYDDSYGMDFLLCKALEWESNNPEEDLKKLERFVNSRLQHISEEIADSICQMEFIHINSNIDNLSPLSLFNNIKIVDFHGENKSNVNDFIPLAKDRYIYVLDYADYETINFDLRSNITSIPNIKYIKGYGIPLELSTIVCDLKGYNIHNINQGYE